MCLIWLGRTTVYSQGPQSQVVLANGQNQYSLGLHLEFLEDTSGMLTIEQVASLDYDTQFMPSLEETPNFGFTQSAIWVRFRVKNQTERPSSWQLMVQDARIGLVELYLPTSDGVEFIRKQAGRWLPFSARDVPHPHYVFELNLPTQVEQTIFMRFQSQSGLTIPLSLWSAPALAQGTQRELLILGLLYGTLLLSLSYSFLLFFSMRDISYLYFALFTTSYLLFQASREGLAHQYLWPTLSGRYSLELFVLLSIIFALQFSATFLSIKTRLPQFQPVITLLVRLTSLTVILILLTRWVNPLLNVLVLLTTISLIAAGCIIWWQGYQPARYYAIAWFLLLALTGARTLDVFNFWDGLVINPKMGLLSFVLMILFFSLALTDRINLLRLATEETNRNLRESENRLNEFLNAMPIGVIVHSRDTKVQYSNQRANQILSLPSPNSKLEDLLFYLANTDERYTQDRLPLRRAFQGEAATADDIDLNLRDHRISLEMWSTPLFDQHGQIHCVISAIQDISKRKQLEGELQQYKAHLEAQITARTEALSASNKQLIQEVAKHKKTERRLHFQKTLLESQMEAAPHGILVVDTERRQWLTANKKFIDMWGITNDVHHTQSSEKALQAVLNQLVDPQAFIASINNYYINQEARGQDEIHLKDGRIFERYTGPVKSADGVYYGRVWFYHNITQRKQTEEALAVARDQALSASHFKTQLLAKVSHELRTPLGAILGFGEMLEEGVYGPLSEAQKVALAAVIDSTQYLISLVNELLDQVQLEAGKLQLKIVTFSPVDLLTQVEASMNVLAQAKGLKLLVDVQPNLPSSMKGDPERIQQVLVNLISNAIKFTEEGQVKVKLYATDDRYWYIKVSDTGSGIPHDAQATIFDPFRQVDDTTTRTQRGAGLGLSIAKQLVDLMQGQVTLDSTVGEGSTFTVSLKLFK